MTDAPQTPATAPGQNDQQSQGTQGQAVRTFTQSELDAIIADRLQRERQKYGDYDALKERAAKLQQIEDAQKTAEQKQQERIAALEQQAEQALSQRREAVLRSAIVAAAAKVGMTDPADAYSLLDKSKLKIGENDTVEGIEEAIKALIESKPYLIAKPATTTQPSQRTSAGNPAGTPNGASLEWYKARRGGGNKGSGFSGGGVIAPE